MECFSVVVLLIAAINLLYKRRVASVSDGRSDAVEAQIAETMLSPVIGSPRELTVSYPGEVATLVVADEYRL